MRAGKGLVAVAVACVAAIGCENRVAPSDADARLPPTGQQAGHQRVRLRHAGLEAIVRKCMANHPADRYQSLADIEAALGTVHKKGSRIRYSIIYALLCAGIAIVSIAVVLLQD